jgi:hypothetical protein
MKAEQPRVADDAAGLFQDLAPQCLFEGLAALRPPARQFPARAVIADQDDAAIGGDADAGRAMRLAGRDRAGRVAGRAPFAAIGAHRERFAVTCDPHPGHTHLPPLAVVTSKSLPATNSARAARRRR